MSKTIKIPAIFAMPVQKLDIPMAANYLSLDIWNQPERLPPFVRIILTFLSHPHCVRFLPAVAFWHCGHPEPYSSYSTAFASP